MKQSLDAIVNVELFLSQLEMANIKPPFELALILPAESFKQFGQLCYKNNKDVVYSTQNMQCKIIKDE